MAKDLKAAGLHRVNVSLDTLDPLKYRAITRVGGLAAVLEGIKKARIAGLEPVKINCVIEEDPNEPDARAVRAFGEENGLEVRYIRRMNLDTGEFFHVIGGDGGHCAECNRLRLTATGQVQPCLFSDAAFSVKELGARNALLNAVKNKPACGSVNHHGRFYNIGG